MVINGVLIVAIAVGLQMTSGTAGNESNAQLERQLVSDSHSWVRSMACRTVDAPVPVNEDRRTCNAVLTNVMCDLSWPDQMSIKVQGDSYTVLGESNADGPTCDLDSLP